MDSPPIYLRLRYKYADYAIWQRQYLNNDLLSKKLEYWEEKLANIEPLNFPFDKPKPAVRSAAGNHISFDLGSTLTEQLRKLCREESVTMFMLLVAVYKVLLYRYTGQYDLCVGIPITNRLQEEVKPLIGFFINTLVLRSNFAGNPEFREVLSRVKGATLEAYRNQEVPFEKIVDRVVKNRDINTSPLFQVIFSLQNSTSFTPLDLKRFRHRSGIL